MLSVNASDIAFITVQNFDYRCIIDKIRNPEDCGTYKKYCLNYRPIQDSFFFTFLFTIYKILDIIDVCRSLNISIGKVMKNVKFCS